MVKLSPVWTDGAAVPDEQPAFEIALTVSGSAADGPRYGGVSMPSSAPPSVSSTWTPSSAPSVSDIAFLSGDSSFPWWVLGMVGGVVLFGAVVVVVLRRRNVPPRR